MIKLFKSLILLVILLFACFSWADSGDPLLSPGSTEITTLGTIAVGTWQGTTISTTYTQAKCTATWPNTYTADQDLQTSDDVQFGSVGVGIAPAADKLFYAYENALNTTAAYTGLYGRVQKTAGASDHDDDYYGLFLQMIMDQSSGEVGHVYGAWVQAALTDGQIGDDSNDRDIVGLVAAAAVAGSGVTSYGDIIGVISDVSFGEATVNGDVIGGWEKTLFSTGTATVSGSAYGSKVELDFASGPPTISTDVYGIHIDVDLHSATVTGKSYMLYLAEDGNLDYGIYQDGSADNILQGNLGLSGVTDPSSALEIDFSTDDIAFDDCGTAGATEDGWIYVAFDSGETGYIRVYNTK